MQPARTSDLGSLGDGDLVPEPDPPVPGEVAGERPRRGACRRVFRHAVRRSEHARLPARAVAREAVRAHDALEALERLDVRLERLDGLDARKRDVDVSHAVVIELDGQLRALNADRLEELVGSRERLDRGNRLAHPAEDDAVFLALEPDGDDSLPGLELDLWKLEWGSKDERRPEDGVAREGQLVHGREDPDPRVAALLGRVDVDRL